jgi:hypothetical protein
MHVGAGEHHASAVEHIQVSVSTFRRG